MRDVDRVWYWCRYLGKHLNGVCAFVYTNAKIDVYVKQIMAQSLADTQHVIEVPVSKEKHSVLNLGNLIIVGGIGYVLFKTFLLEERVNDLTVLIRRQSGNGMRSDIPTVTPSTMQHAQNAQNEYETSDDDDDDDDDEEDEVRIEEQPREVPPLAEIPTSKVAVAAPSASAFVTTRQRRSGSELRRDSSRTGASTREA